MASINFINVTVTFNLISAEHRSLKKKLLLGKSKFKNIINSNSEGMIKVEALKEINLSINDGDRIGVMGPNGAGKSTFLRVASQIYAPTTGEVEVDGSVLPLINPSIALDPFSSGIENIKSRAILMGVKKEQINDFVNSVSDISELGDYLYLPFHTYSSGMQMRMAFAISMATKPDILVMDEWLSVADEEFQEKSTKLLNEKINQSKILILASHDKELINSICNKFIYLENGNALISNDFK